MTRFNEVGFESEAEHSNDVVGLGMRCDFLDTFGLGFDCGDGGDGDCDIGAFARRPVFAFNAALYFVSESVSVHICHVSGFVFIICLLNSEPFSLYFDFWFITHFPNILHTESFDCDDGAYPVELMHSHINLCLFFHS